MRSGIDDVRGAPGNLGGTSTSGIWLAQSVTEPPPGTVIAQEPQKSGSWRILLMIEDIDLGEWLLGELRLLGAFVAWSTKASEGLTLARSGLVDVVIAEMGLPDLHGMDLLRELRNMTKMPKVILTTSCHFDFLAKRAIEGGATAILSKPIQMEQLEELLTRLLGD